MIFGVGIADATHNDQKSYKTDRSTYWVWEPFADTQTLMTLQQMESSWGTYSSYAWVPRKNVQPGQTPIATQPAPPPIQLSPYAYQSEPVRRPVAMQPAPQPVLPHSYSYPAQPVGRVIQQDPDLADLHRRLDILNAPRR